MKSLLDYDLLVTIMPEYGAELDSQKIDIAGKAFDWAWNEQQERIDKLERDIKQLRINFAKYLVPLYKENLLEVARACDEEIDRTGALLGYLREEATKK